MFPVKGYSIIINSNAIMSQKKMDNSPVMVPVFAKNKNFERLKCSLY